VRVLRVKSGSFRFDYVQKRPWYRRDKNWWVIVDPHYLDVEHDGAELRLEVPEGYLTDGASVPRSLWRLFPPHGPYSRAAFFHDLLCDTKGVNIWTDADGEKKTIRLSSKETHHLFKNIMLFLGLNRTRVNMMWNGVRLGGPRWS